MRTASRLILPRDVRGMASISHQREGILCSARCLRSHACRSRTVASLLSAYDVRRAGTADVTRCRETLAPFASSDGVEVTTLPATTAGTFEDDRDAAVQEVLALLDGAHGAAWCGQREVIPDLAVALHDRLGGHADGAGRSVSDLADLRKGGLLLLHVDEGGRLATVERLPG